MTKGIVLITRTEWNSNTFYFILHAVISEKIINDVLHEVIANSKNKEFSC